MKRINRFQDTMVRLHSWFSLNYSLTLLMYCCSRLPFHVNLTTSTHYWKPHMWTDDCNNHNHPVKKEEKKPSSINTKYSTRWIVFVVVNFSWYPYFENEHEGRQLNPSQSTITPKSTSPSDIWRYLTLNNFVPYIQLCKMYLKWETLRWTTPASIMERKGDNMLSSSYIT